MFLIINIILINFCTWWVGNVSYHYCHADFRYNVLLFVVYLVTQMDTNRFIAQHKVYSTKKDVKIWKLLFNAKYKKKFSQHKS